MSFMRLGSPTVPICVTDTSMEFTMGCVLVTCYFSPLLVFIIRKITGHSFDCCHYDWVLVFEEIKCACQLHSSGYSEGIGT